MSPKSAEGQLKRFLYFEFEFVKNKPQNASLFFNLNLFENEPETWQKIPFFCRNCNLIRNWHVLKTFFGNLWVFLHAEGYDHKKNLIWEIFFRRGNQNPPLLPYKLCHIIYVLIQNKMFIFTSRHLCQSIYYWTQILFDVSFLT